MFLKQLVISFLLFPAYPHLQFLKIIFLVPSKSKHYIIAMSGMMIPENHNCVTVSWETNAATTIREMRSNSLDFSPLVVGVVGVPGDPV